MKYPRHQLQALPENTSGRDFVIGDLHGCHDELLALLADVGFDRNHDRLLSVGDLVDRGPGSLQCLKLLDEPWFHPVWGNHESLMLDALTQGQDSKAFGLWMLNGGDWALQQDAGALRAGIETAAARVPLALEVPVGDRRVGIVHAEVPEHDWRSFAATMPDEDKETAIWSRSAIMYARVGTRCPDINHIDLVFMGHTALPEIKHTANRCYLDTGAGYRKGRLSIVELQALLARD